MLSKDLGATHVLDCECYQMHFLMVIYPVSKNESPTTEQLIVMPFAEQEHTEDSTDVTILTGFSFS